MLKAAIACAQEMVGDSYIIGLDACRQLGATQELVLKLTQQNVGFLRDR